MGSHGFLHTMNTMTTLNPMYNEVFPSLLKIKKYHYEDFFDATRFSPSIIGKCSSFEPVCGMQSVQCGSVI